jgi:tRNA dimethylallyltransferase
MLASGVPGTAHPFTGLVYRQILEYLRGDRDEAATRALIVQENRRYARRQLIWFRKEPNLFWLDGAGEAPDTVRAAAAALAARGMLTDGADT